MSERDRCEACGRPVSGRNNILDCTTSPPNVTCTKCLNQRIKAEWEAVEAAAAAKRRAVGMI